MVRYFYAWTPARQRCRARSSSCPMSYLALIALMLVSLVALAALAWAIVAVPYLLGRAIRHRWRGRSTARPRTAAVLSPVNSGVRSDMSTITTKHVRGVEAR